MLTRLKLWARRLKTDLTAMWLAARDPEVPRLPKLIALAVAGYALSPIDLIPDFIPVIGYLDDLLIIPAGIWLAARLIPELVLTRLRAEAAARPSPPASKLAALLFIGIWVAIGLYVGWLLLAFD